MQIQTRGCPLLNYTHGLSLSERVMSNLNKVMFAMGDIGNELRTSQRGGSLRETWQLESSFDTSRVSLLS